MIASPWSSKSNFGLGFLDFEMTLRPERWKMSICYGKARLQADRVAEGSRLSPRADAPGVDSGTARRSDDAVETGTS